MAESGDGKATAIVQVEPEESAPPPPAQVTSSSSSPPAPSMRSERSISAVQFRASFGLMTDPQSLREYEESMPGAGKLIIQQFFDQTNREQEHRHKIEDKYSEAEIANDDRLIRQGDRAQKIGGSVIALVVLLAAYMVSKGHAAEAATVVGVVCGGTLGTYIYGRKKQADEVKAVATSQKPPAAAGTVAATAVDDSLSG